MSRILGAVQISICNSAFKSIHFSIILCRLSRLWSIFNLVKNTLTDPSKLSNLGLHDIQRIYPINFFRFSVIKVCITPNMIRRLNILGLKKIIFKIKNNAEPLVIPLLAHKLNARHLPVLRKFLDQLPSLVYRCCASCQLWKYYACFYMQK